LSARRFARLRPVVQPGGFEDLSAGGKATVSTLNNPDDLLPAFKDLDRAVPEQQPADDEPGVAHGHGSILLPRANGCCWCIRRCGITGRTGRNIIAAGGRRRASHDKYGEFRSHGGCARSLADGRVAKTFRITASCIIPAGRTRPADQVLATAGTSLRAKPIHGLVKNIPRPASSASPWPRRRAHESGAYKNDSAKWFEVAAGK